MGSLDIINILLLLGYIRISNTFKIFIYDKGYAILRKFILLWTWAYLLDFLNLDIFSSYYFSMDKLIILLLFPNPKARLDWVSKTFLVFLLISININLTILLAPVNYSKLYYENFNNSAYFSDASSELAGKILTNFPKFLFSYSSL